MSLDPRVFGFDYTQGLVPNDAFNGSWGEAVPSSDGDEGESVMRMVAGEVRPVSQPQQQPVYAMQAQDDAQPLYRPAPTAPLYADAGQYARAVMPRYAPGEPGAIASQRGAYAGLEHRQQPQQPQPSHPSEQEHYAWQSHPAQGYSQPFTGPDGTSPMQRGGPNVGAYANAPKPPEGYTGAAYPYTTPGVQQQNNGNPLFGGFAGLDMSGLDAELGLFDKHKENKAARQAERGRQVRGKDGAYVYYQFASVGNPIRIDVSGDARRLPEGTILQKGDPRWSVITAEIGTWDIYANERRAKALTAVSGGLTALSKIGGKKRRGGKRRRKGQGQGQGQGPPVVAPAYVPPEGGEEGGGLPPWLLPVGALVLVGAVVLFATSGKKTPGA